MRAVCCAAILYVAGVTAAAADSAAIELRASAGRTISAMGADSVTRRCRKRRLAYYRRKNQSCECQIFHIVPPGIYRGKMLPEGCRVNAAIPLLQSNYERMSGLAEITVRRRGWSDKIQL
jgi:hypothetical protein